MGSHPQFEEFKRRAIENPEVRRAYEDAQRGKWPTRWLLGWDRFWSGFKPFAIGAFWACLGVAQIIAGHMWSTGGLCLLLGFANTMLALQGKRIETLEHDLAEARRPTQASGKNAIL